MEKSSTINKLQYPQEYLRSQVLFAKKVSEVAKIPLLQSILEFTAIYRRIMDKKYDPDDLTPPWNEVTQILANNKNSSTITQMIFDVYIRQPQSKYQFPPYGSKQKYFGPFCSNYDEEKREIRLHFTNSRRGPKSDLSRDYIPDCVKNLKEMFTWIKKSYTEAQCVVCGTWLNNYESFTRLFPPEYVKNKKRLLPPQMTYGGDSLWGQFIDSYGNVNEEMFNKFTRSVNDITNIEKIPDVFPFHPLELRSAVQYFYSKYV